MARIRSSLDQIVTPAFYRPGLETRWVGFGFEIAAGIGNEQWDITINLAEQLSLKAAKLILTATTAGALIDCNWRIITCTEPPAAAGQIANQLEPVVAVLFANKPYAFYKGTDRSFDFLMNRFYSGAGRRFAVWVQNNSAAVGIFVTAAFLISEG